VKVIGRKLAREAGGKELEIGYIRNRNALECSTCIAVVANTARKFADAIFCR
jgi:hypothetical protein